MNNQFGRRTFLQFLGLTGVGIAASPLLKAAEAAIPDPIPTNLDNDLLGFANFLIKRGDIWKKIGFVERFEFTTHQEFENFRVYDHPMEHMRRPMLLNRYITGSMGFMPMEYPDRSESIAVMQSFMEARELETRICLDKEMYVEGNIRFDTLNYSYDARCNIMDLDFSYIGQAKLVDYKGNSIGS